MRLLLLWAITLGSLPIALVQPYFGLLIYSWLAYMRPHDMLWGAPPPVSLLVACATLGGVVLSLGRERLATFKPQTVLLLAFGTWFLLSTITAVDPALATAWAVLIGKILLISVLTTGLICTLPRFRHLYLVIALSLGLLGIKFAVYGIIRGGIRIVEGPGGFMTDNNSFAMALNMAIPLLIGVAVSERQRFVRVLAWIMIASCAISVIFTFSRGGLLTLGVVVALLLVRSGRPLLVVLVLAGALAILLGVASTEFGEAYSSRAGTIGDYRADESAMGRIREWGVALRIFPDYPVFGVGPDNLKLVRHFYAQVGSKFAVTHNSFLQLLVAVGLPGLALFVGALAVSAIRLSTLRQTSQSDLVREYASMIQISIIAFAAGGMLLDMAYFDLIYHLVAMSAALEVAAASAPARSKSGAVLETSREVWWREKPAAKVFTS